MLILTPERRARIALSHLSEPSDIALGRLVAEYGAVNAIHFIREHTSDDDPERHQLLMRVKPRDTKAALDDLFARIERASESLGMQVLIPGDAKWPVALDDLGTLAPHALYVIGDAQHLVIERSVSIVGARASTSYGEHITMELAADLATDHAIVSGAAYGIDGTAHRAALAAGGTTIAVLAGGIDRPYPAGHAELIRRVGQSGAIIGEVPPGSAPTRWRFLQRNRLIAALGQASIVVEAGFRSGSLNEAAHAVSLGRPVGAVPGPLTSAASTGCHHLIREGATLVTNADDVRALTRKEV